MVFGRLRKPKMYKRKDLKHPVANERKKTLGQKLVSDGRGNWFREITVDDFLSLGDETREELRPRSIYTRNGKVHIPERRARERAAAERKKNSKS